MERAELASDHGLRKLKQDFLFGREDVLEAPTRNTCGLGDLAYRCGVVALLKEQTHAGGQYLLLGRGFIFALGHKTLRVQ